MRKTTVHTSATTKETKATTKATTTAAQDTPFTGIPVAITNQLSVPLDIYDVFNPAATGQTVPYLYTKLGTIAAGATASVTTIRQVAQLEAMYSGTVPELQGWYYQQFPIKLMSGTQFSFGTPPPLAYTIASADRDAMIQSFLFHKFAMANPDSALTKNLNAALKSTDPKAVNAFFAGTQNFKACTLSSWNAVMTWLTMFTSGWQGPYYLYEAAPANPPQNYVPALVGALKVNSTASDTSATLTLAAQDADGSMHPLTPTQASTVVMAGDGTMVDANPGQDVTLSLTPVWMNTIQTTMNGNQPETNYISGPTLTGTVAGRNVVSTQVLMPLPSQASKSGSSSSGSTSQTFGTICQVVGLIVGLVMLYEIAEKRLSGKQTAEEQAKKDATSESDYEKRVKTVNEDPSTGTAEVFEQNASKFTNDSGAIADGYKQVSQTQQKDVLNEAINTETEKLSGEINEQLENGLTPTQTYEDSVVQTMDSFKQAGQQIDDGNLTEASSTMSKAGEAMQQTLDTSSGELQASEQSALENSAETVTKATDAADSLSKAQNQYEEEMNTEVNDSGAPKTDEVNETEEFDFA